MPAIYAVCEAIRSWLGDNNEKGLDDVSMHAQMMRKQMEAEKLKVCLCVTFVINIVLFCFSLSCLYNQLSCEKTQHKNADFSSQTLDLLMKFHTVFLIVCNNQMQNQDPTMWS